MGLLGFGNILGFNHYFGKTEYKNDNDFDGMWAIWDEPFLQYFAKNTGKKQPFMATVFTASSHHPFKIPEKYNGKFRKGKNQMHEPIQYTDYAIKEYFETARKQPWFKNTIFVFTGDHTNEVYYPEYEKIMNRFAVPLIFYSPNPEYHLKGVNPEFAQQIDIYPTLADLIGYNKKIRSWGRSLVSEKREAPIIANSDGSVEQFIIGNYIYRFDGKNVVGVFDKTDLGLEKNLMDQLKSKPEIQKGILIAKAWYQDYMNRVINRKLY
jgi:phosphoglycerol transferase MdoB-like AlkP superfamily enzyme